MIRCKVDHDCVVRSGKPIFVYKSKGKHEFNLSNICDNFPLRVDGKNDTDDESEYESCLTIKDINDFYHALNQVIQKHNLFVKKIFIIGC